MWREAANHICKEQTTKEEVNRALKNASENSLKGVLGFCSEELVSVDFMGCALSSTVDADCTMVVDKKLVKVVAWYDNETGFSTRMLDVCQMIGKSLA